MIEKPCLLPLINWPRALTGQQRYWPVLVMNLTVSVRHKNAVQVKTAFAKHKSDGLEPALAGRQVNPRRHGITIHIVSSEQHPILSCLCCGVLRGGAEAKQ